jgi:hypothetical protein
VPLSANKIQKAPLMMESTQRLRLPVRFPSVWKLVGILLLSSSQLAASFTLKSSNTVNSRPLKNATPRFVASAEVAPSPSVEAPSDLPVLGPDGVYHIESGEQHK